MARQKGCIIIIIIIIIITIRIIITATIFKFKMAARYHVDSEGHSASYVYISSIDTIRIKLVSCKLINRLTSERNDAIEMLHNNNNNNNNNSNNNNGDHF